MNRPPHPGARITILIACIAILGSTLLSSQSASAHDALAASTPAAGETVTTNLEKVSLTFTEAPLSDFETATIIRVTGPDGVDIVSGEVSIADNIITAPVTFEITGDYLLQWQTVSVDGHPISGEFSFSYTAQPTAVPAPETPARTAPPEAARVPDASTSNAAEQDATAPATATVTAADLGQGVLPIIALGVLGAGIVIMGVAFALRRFHKTKPPTQ
ncbi:copper resistance CopC family protein [Subtercola boreus]|nr:copper resistance CopC family protein [Subtercola boreus]TQL46920.1 hypothetical protein FB464_3915 [Subtercola boreus]